MTIRELMNTANCHPDVTITVKQIPVGSNPILYSGKYDESTEDIYNLNVHAFSVESITQESYQLYAHTTDMIIFVI